MLTVNRALLSMEPRLESMGEMVEELDFMRHCVSVCKGVTLTPFLFHMSTYSLVTTVLWTSTAESPNIHHNSCSSKGYNNMSRNIATTCLMPENLSLSPPEASRERRLGLVEMAVNIWGSEARSL